MLAINSVKLTSNGCRIILHIVHMQLPLVHVQLPRSLLQDIDFQCLNKLSPQLKKKMAQFLLVTLNGLKSSIEEQLMMRMMLRNLIPLVFPALLFGTQVHAGVIYNAVGDFSATENTTNSTWSYRATNDLVRDGSYELIDGPSGTLWEPGTIRWNAGAFKFVAVNHSGDSISADTVAPFPWPDNTILMHPGGDENNSLGLVAVSWLAPADGIANVSFEFTDLDPYGGDGVEWAVDLGDSSGNLASGLIRSTTTLLDSTGLLELNDIPVAAGDRLHFIVSPRDSRNHLNDSTSLTASIEHISASVPEPASWLLLGLALPFLFRSRRQTIILKLPR